MTPEMWLDLGPSHTVLDTAFPQIANSLGDSARCCLSTALAFTFYPGRCMPSPLRSWYHGRVGRGAKIVQVSASSKGAAYAASGAQSITPEPLGVVPHARGGGDSELCFCRPSVDNPLKPQWGSILLLVRASLSSNWSVTNR